MLKLRLGSRIAKARLSSMLRESRRLERESSKFLESLGIEAVAAHERRLLALATGELERIPGLEIIGTATHKAAVLSFTLRGCHPHDLGTILDTEGVAIRTGHHCAMPVMTFFDIPATARASFGCYNTEADVYALVAALGKAREVFG